MTTRVDVAAPEIGLRPSTLRWVVLGGYALLTAATQMLWLSFAAVDTRAAAAMHTDVGVVGDLAIVFPLVYVVLALPTGRWLDARFGRALGTGAVLTATGAVIRITAPTSLAVQVAGQCVIAIAQPLVLNSITKVAARYFPPHERATAISIGSVALFAGILGAVLLGGPLFDAGGLGLLLAVEAIPALVGAVLVLAILRVPPQYGDGASAAVRLTWLLHNRFMWTLAGLVFIGMGTYNAVATWLEPILKNYGEAGAAGNLVAIMTVAGIAGAAVLPAWVAARDRRRSMLLVAVTTSAVVFTAVALRHDAVWIGAWFVLEGFVLLASLPVVLDWSEVHAGAQRQGEAAGFLLMAGNLGGLVLPGVLQVILGSGALPLLLLAGAGAAGIPLSLQLPRRGDPRA